jgi:hypothetical protein
MEKSVGAVWWVGVAWRCCGGWRHDAQWVQWRTTSSALLISAAQWRTYTWCAITSSISIYNPVLQLVVAYDCTSAPLVIEYQWSTTFRCATAI